MSNPRVFIVSGPSGVGKSSIIVEALARRNELRLSISTTTRSPREGEQEGRDYFFVDRNSFERRIDQGGFLEWALSYDNYYGTGVREIERILSEGCHALLDVDTQGALQIKKAFSGGAYIFIKPPSLESLEARLRGRGSESEETLRKRLERAESEIGYSGEYDHIVVNANLEDAIASFIEIVDRESSRPVKFVKIGQAPSDASEEPMVNTARQALERIDREEIVRALQSEMKSTLLGELETLIRERLERILREDLGTIVEKVYRESVQD